tara:strand:+ start:164 stop:808 length:645 start_codon:yes stop_codon:yes gene_type:complete
MSKIETYDLKRGQIEAIEVIATSPGTSNKALAEKIGVSESTMSNWRKNPVFIEACYDRFVEINGTRLMRVLNSMFEEAEAGSVPAAQLILNHYNKLNNKVELTIDSPWEKFLKNKNMTDYEVIDVKEPEVVKERTVIDDDKVLKVERKRLKSIITETKQQKVNRDQNKRYKLRQRAQRVNLEPLPAGRQPDHVRKEWLKKLEKREKELGIGKKN